MLQVGKVSEGMQVRLCMNCAAPIIVPANSRKIYCSPRCANIAAQRRFRQRKRASDPEWARAELERLLRWRAQHRKNQTGKAVNP